MLRTSEFSRSRPKFADSPVKIESAINQFTMETKRLLHVLDLQLAKHPYVAGDEYSIADIAAWPWYGRIVLGRSYPGSKVFLNVEAEYPNVVRWAKHLEETRPAVRRGQMVNVVTRDSKLVDKHPEYRDLPALPNRHSRSDWGTSAV